MPAPDAILATLTRIANESAGTAIAWHAVVLLVVLALALGFRPSARAAALSLSIPLASVSLLAASYGNPFNGAVFALAAGGLAILAGRKPAQPVRLGQPGFVVLGAVLVVFGLIYPHFVNVSSPLAYVYAAPLGTIPCPTLALATGAALVGGGLVGGAWRLVLALIAAFYACFGLFRLGVTLDVVLALGAVGLSAQHWLQKRPRPLDAAKA